MRRTYRSKKDTGGGIDHRDMVLSVDSKSSLFDAYYIQNIKQVKREMSCVISTNPYTVPSYKVRKRKYVKRLKEPEPLRESLSESAYLTPDKSIRVNRVPDLFDQLLNSSTNVLSPKTTSTTNYNYVNNILQSKMSSKTYCRKRLSKLTKMNNYSKESSDSDKENSFSDESHLSNTSNIKAHKLVIEKERVSNPVPLDDSINKMASKFSALNKLSQKSMRNSKDESSKYNYIHINNTHSPLLQTSPQCSTPFQEKYRGKSIYNFSPIQINLLEEDSLKLKSIDENVHYESVHSDENVHEESVHSNHYEKLGNNNAQNIANVTTSGLIIETYETENATENIIHDNEIAKDNVVLLSNSCLINDQMLNNETGSLYTTELEPFYGFSVPKSAQNNEGKPKNLENSSKNELCSNCTVIDSVFDTQVLSQPTICKSIDNIHTFSNNITQSINDSDIHIVEIVNEMPGNSFNYVESESCYDTCDSENISDASCSDDVNHKELVVIMERLSNSIFEKYYNRMVESSLNNENNSSNHDSKDNEIPSNINECNYTSFKDMDPGHDVSSNSSNNDMHSDKDGLNGKELEFIAVQIISSSENENSDSNEVEDEDKCVSFVTTRRRNDVTNDSFMFNLNNSFSSALNVTLDKTVISYNRERLEKTEVIENDTLVNDSIESDICNDNTEAYKQASDDELQLKAHEFTESLKSLKSVNDEEVTNINTRKSSKLFRESMYCLSQTNADETSNGLKQGIVLKPGKKWERSLSIYRRMTTMGDTFDRSILDDESLKSKGRKYSQSVINMMEMQQLQGSLHNESVFSRRSTFVSKPRRSTIKIFKDPNASDISLSSSVLYDDLEGFLNGDCDDTIIELSKLSIGDSGHEVTILDKFHDTSNRLVTARDYVLRRCNQTEPVLFDECYPDTVLKNCRKIGEGVYGEVFLWRAGDGRARVMKIVPIAGVTRVNGEEQKDYHEIISEIVIAMELSALRAPIPEIQRQLDDGKEIDGLDLHSVQNATDVFNEVVAVRCVYGAYPSRLLDLWELYDECKGSENDNPAALPVDQQYIVLELANAGQDLESYQFGNAEQACALFKQIALGLAVAEESFQFEHRDLHWGNVLIAPTDQKYATFVVRGRLYRTARCGVAATLIDYSLSRAAREGRALYNDLAEDDALFDAVGDYQFEVYRLMRDKLGNDWKNFEPYTNILWLHYTVDKMITALRYTRTNTKIHKHYIAKLKEIKNRVLNYGSATQFILTDNEF